MKVKAVILILLFTITSVTAQDKNRLNVNENHAPVFIKEMPDTFILVGKTLLFQYKATDQDGDSISYSVKSVLPMNATLLPKTGVFSWRPINSQQGKYELIVSASDGKLSTVSRKIIIETTFLWDDFGSGSLTINVSHGIGGEVEKHINNDTAFVRAIPYKGYRFTSWTEKGIIVSTDSVYKFRITGSRDLLANFRINHAPVFVKEMADTTFIQDLIVGSYRAIDPDGDSVKYYATQLFPKRAGVILTTGVFGWRPLQLEGAMNFIQIYATDGQLKTYSKISNLYYLTLGTYYSKTLNLKVKPNDAGYAYRIITNDTINLRAVPYKGYKFLNWTYSGSIVSQDSIFTIFEKNIEGHVLLDANFSEITSIQSEEKLPSEYHLTQNFPNPFNPTTTIEYTIPHAEHVTLKVFDVLGREVATLVNEYKQAGAYKTNFDASGLVSGVYFYQLSAGSFVETKKLIILR